MSNFIQLFRSSETQWLIENKPNAFLLLMWIGTNAKWKPSYLEGLLPGECILGDPSKQGMTREARNVALGHLEELGFVSVLAKGRNLTLKREIFENGQKRHIKTLINGTLVRIWQSDICSINEQDNTHQNTHPAHIKHTSNTHQNGGLYDIKSDKSDKSSKDRHLKSDRLDCSHVDKSHAKEETPTSRTCQHATQSDESLFLDKFSIDDYRFPDGSPVSSLMKATAKSSPHTMQRFIRNLLVCAEDWENGVKPVKSNTYEKMLQGYINKDVGAARLSKSPNQIFAELCKIQYPQLDISIRKSIVQVRKGDVKESFPLELDVDIFQNRLAQTLQEMEKSLSYV